jgi:hypothetical protein
MNRKFTNTKQNGVDLMSYYIYKHLDLKGEVIYVGQTKDMKNRQGTHRHKEYMDKIMYVEVKTREIMDLYEKFYISKYNPKFNIASIDCNYTEYLIDLEHKFIEYNRESHFKQNVRKREIHNDSIPYIKRVLCGEFKNFKCDLSKEDYDNLKLTARTLAHNIKKYIVKNYTTNGVSLKIFKLILIYKLLRIIGTNISENKIKNFIKYLEDCPVQARHLKETNYIYKTFKDFKIYHWKENIYYIGRTMVILNDSELLSLSHV